LNVGMLKFQLFGSKIRGSFALVKTKGFGPKNSWLMIKHKDSHFKTGYDANNLDISVTTNRSMAEILKDETVK
jgi:bifunctional non-homologous end joining protein LigD